MKVNIGNFKKNGNPRTIKIQVDNWDIWNADHTLAMIIHPVLVKFKENLHSHPHDISHEEWEEILDKMIFSFGAISDNWFFEDKFFSDNKWNEEEFDEYNKKVQEGLDLFGKWFRALWD